MPDWLAAIVQIPTARSEMVEPETEHTDAVCEVKVTGRPELALTGGAKGGEPRVSLDIAGKLMVWDSSAAVTEND